MSASSSKGVTVDIVTGGATGTKVKATAVTKAKPAAISVASAAGFVAGDIVKLAANSTGFSELDGKTFVIKTVDDTANTITLLGSDTTSSTDTFLAGDDIIIYKKADVTRLCLSELTFNAETADTVSVGTFCDPSAQIASAQVGAGTVDFAGYIDITDAGYIELLKASEDNLERIVRINLPNNGSIVFPMTISQMTLQVPVEGALAFSGSGALGSKPRHLF
jgi:hypothetical protein